MKVFVRRYSFGLIVLSALTALALASCNLNTDYFSDYNGKNLISGYDFAATTKWALVPTTGTDPVITTYMAPWPGSIGNNNTAGPDGTSGYRIEILNLIPKGDFESAWSVASPWSETGTPTVVRTTTPMTTSGLLLDENFLDVSLANVNTPTTLSAGDSLAIDLRAATMATNPAAWVPGSYQFDMDFIEGDITLGDGVYLDFEDGVTDTQGWTVGTSGLLATRYRLANIGNPVPFVVTSGDQSNPRLLSLYTPLATHIGIDNLKLVRDDLNLSVRTTLSSINSSSAQLIPGTYVFSVYVHDDVNADQTSGTHIANRMYATGLSVQITATRKPGTTETFKTFFPRPSGGWTIWTKLTYNLGTVDFVDSDSNLNGNPALTIDLSPTNLVGGNNQRTAGSLLIESPNLQFLH